MDERTTPFFRLLNVPIEEKGEALAAQIAALQGESLPEGAAKGSKQVNTFKVAPTQFSNIEGSPFAYWVSDSIRALFAKLPKVQAEGRDVCFGLSTKDDFRFLRLSWEINASDQNRTWFPFAKGGAYSPYYYDVHLLLDWENDGARLKTFAEKRTEEIFGRASWSRWINNWVHYFRPGLTWPRRTQKGFNVRALPAGSIFGDKGPTVFYEGDLSSSLLALLALMNSSLFQLLLQLQMAFGSYEVGVVQRTPLPKLSYEFVSLLASLADRAHDLQRSSDLTDETTHPFTLPGLVKFREGTLLDGSVRLEQEAQIAQVQLARIQQEIDEHVFDLYELSEADRALVRAEMEHPDLVSLEESDSQDEENDEEEPATPEDFPARVANLLMWCVGVAFGRWDVRFALDPELLPSLQGPFDPLPTCAPGALVGPDRLPARKDSIVSEEWLHARTSVLDSPTLADTKSMLAPNYPLPIAWNGILVDDPTHEWDILRRVRTVLELLWGARAEAIEQEACEALEVKTLRDWFRDPRKGFFSTHIKRYSKSRRRAPLYWLLQSGKRNYAIWLYAHRLDHQSLYAAARSPYADVKVTLESEALERLKEQAQSNNDTVPRPLQRKIDQQQKLVAEVTAFRDTLDQIALLNLPLDLNDGVTLCLAPLHPLVPWKEAEKIWNKLVAGEYEWSTLGRRMAERGLIR